MLLQYKVYMIKISVIIIVIRQLGATINFKYCSILFNYSVNEISLLCMQKHMSFIIFCEEVFLLFIY